MTAFPSHRATVVAALVASGVAVWAWSLPSDFPPREEFSVRGIDVSHHQGVIDWQAVAADGIDFAFIKASEGTTLRAPRFESNAKAATAAGIAWAPYHYFHFCSDGAAQARHFLAMTHALRGDLPPAIDVESVGNCRDWHAHVVTTELRIMLEAMAAAKETVVVYADQESYRLVPRTHATTLLWARDLGSEPGWLPRWSFWQLADDGWVEGIPSRVDLDVFSGTKGELEALTSRRRRR